jgi:hypothetical protein
MKQVQAPKQKEKKVVVPTIRWKTFASPEREKPYCCPLPCHINNLQQLVLIEMVVMILFFVMVIVMMVRLRVKWLGVI